MLANLKEKNPQLVNRLAQRLFFVVNKIDCIHSSDGDSPLPFHSLSQGSRVTSLHNSSIQACHCPLRCHLEASSFIPSLPLS